jgi:hypothetical protein
MVALYITIDTEYEFGFTAKHGASSRAENFRRSIQCTTPDGDVGIFHQMDVFDRHGMKAVFFVDPMPALLWGKGAIADVVEPIIERGHDVQLHLHTEWLELLGPANPLGERTGANIKDFTREEQVILLETATDLLMRAGAPRPVAFRAGNYGANDDTLRALAKVGLTHDTSHPPGLMQGDCEIRLGEDDRRPLRRHGVIEVPIGCIGDALGGLRHAQLTALSYREIMAALRHARSNSLACFTVVSHSFELLCRQRTRINRIVQRRFEKVCAHVETMKGVSTATYADRLPRPTKRPSTAPVLAPAPILNGTRMVEQAVANALYGRKSTPHDDEGTPPESTPVAKALLYLEIANRTRIG